MVYPITHVRWPIVHGTGVEPTFAQNVVALGGLPLRINKSYRDYFYSSDALANCCPRRVWMHLANSLAVADSDIRFDTWSVMAHVRANRQSWTRGCFRNGSTSSSLDDEQIPLCPRAYQVLPTFPPSWRDLKRSQSDDILYRSRHYHRDIARNSSQSRAIYIRSFISTDDAPTPVGFVIAGNGPRWILILSAILIPLKLGLLVSLRPCGSPL